MRRLTDYQAVIVDMDGTLYYQNPVRLAMLKEMLFQFWRMPELLVVKKYRDLYERGISQQDRYSQLPDDAPQIIHEWMIERPLPYVYKYRDQNLIDLLKTAAVNGIFVIVYSDYPVLEKLMALRYKPDKALFARNSSDMKPEASGLIKCLNDLEISSERCLVIGDRQDKDGIMANILGADCIILPRGNRVQIYQSIQV